MPLGLLRRIAFEGDLTNWIHDPPRLLAPPFPVTGLHLRFDSWFLARITDLIYEGVLRIRSDEHPHDMRALLQTKRDERRSACWYAIENSGSDRYRALEALSGWEVRCREMGYPKHSKPVVIIIDYGPEAERTWLRELPREHMGYPIRYRPSPIAEAHLGPGSRIGNGGPNFGTLGGFLQDSVTQDLFAVTCAHVAGVPKTSVGDVDRHGNLLNAIGTVAASTLPPTSGPCNRHAKPGGGIDAALIAIDSAALPVLQSSLSVESIDDIDQEDPILFDGSKSGRVTALVATATIWKVVDIAGQRHCFGDVFALGHRQVGYVLQALSRPADSGAWVFEDRGSASTKWLGMLIAGDKQHNQSLACYGEHVFTWARAVRADLVLPP